MDYGKRKRQRIARPRWGGKTRFYVSPYGRTLKTALAIAEAFHPKLKVRLKNAHVNLPEEKALALLKLINGKTLERLGAYDRRKKVTWDDSDRLGYGIRDVHNLFKGFSKQPKTHLILVSHVELLHPILSALAKRNPEIPYDAKTGPAVRQLEHFTLHIKPKGMELELRGRKFKLPPISSF